MMKTVFEHSLNTALLTLVALGFVGAVRAENTNLSFNADVTGRVGFDNNVYLQDKDPDLTAVPQAVSPFQESVFFSVTPKAGLDYEPCAAFNAVISYAPEVVYYTAEPSEDHVSHRALLNLGGKVGDVSWKCANAFTYVQGSNEGLYFGAQGGAPAIGGIPIRDRRRQFVYRGKLYATWNFGKWFFRPEVCGYWHDFQTEQRSDPGYENYIDRRELCVGGDLGYQIMSQTRFYGGFRFGYEVQGHLLDSPYHYDAEYYRPVLGIEGQPATWVKLNFSLGPDIHHTIHEVSPNFDPNYTTLWVDGTVTLMPSSRDSIVLRWTQNTQPAYASTSVYDDIVYSIAGQHRFDEHWSADAGFKAYNGDWFPPVERDDWIFTPSARVGYRHDEHLSAELAYSYDWTVSKVPNTDGRNFNRHLIWLSLRYEL